jgi:hypothetical protein
LSGNEKKLNRGLFFKIISQIVFAIVLIAGTSVWCSLTLKEKEPVPLTKGLHGKWADVSKEFDLRVKAAFPLGLPVESMGDELSRQGFSREDWATSADKEHRAVRDESNFVCNQGAIIYWRANSEGKLTSIRGEYGERGCL